ncbi:hypothetical protein HQ865_18195 [Mucilaginibacter mali]|uniref:DoxX family protein n=1 Tax=Mucilaginibacter mali TaxID=2740462 RepID=A0A7D4TP99_9SPHI|nr:hypothetical protein [Mucilaginibacter mali]QKJ31613.1 hypothetical protein HQ865_18195 [Mucilaginibacter mali]
MTTNNTLAQPWSISQKILFRFAFLFFALFIFFFPNAGAPGLNQLYDLYIIPMHNLMVWMAAHVFHLTRPLTVFTNGSGDTTYDWLVLFMVAICSVIGAAIWTALSKGQMSYDRLYYWMIIVLRYYVGITMLAYGSVKVVQLQFPAPTPWRLIEPYGNSSPFTLAWTFMGYSRGYNYFTGIAEVSCGILLLFKRTSLFGAVIAFTVAANITAINFCFDVPVKIVASALLLMVTVILLKDMQRFIDFFFLNKTTGPANLTPRRFQKKWKNITLIVVKYVLIVYVTLSNVDNMISGYHNYGMGVKHPVLYGVFNTKSFVLNKDTIAPLTTDTTRWRLLQITSFGRAAVVMMNDSAKNYSYKADTAKKTITLGDMKDTTCKYVFNYTLSKDSVLRMDGIGPAGQLSAEFKRFNEQKSVLIKRGFHFVNEYPFAK